VLSCALKKTIENNKMKNSLRRITFFGFIATSNSLFAAGFVEDADVTLNFRNFYMNRNYIDNGNSRAVPGPTDRGMAREWTQNFILNARSGFTPGPVGFGVDALGLFGVKLDGGRGTYGTTALPTHDGNRPADNFGRLAIAGKAKFSKTQFKVGEWFSELPILQSSDSRSLPQTFQGAMVTSEDLPNFTLYGGRMTGNSQRNDASLEKLSAGGIGTVTHGQNSIEADTFTFAGVERSLNENRSSLGLWYGELEDIYQQRYIRFQHVMPITDDLSLGAKIGYFDYTEDGKALGGDIDNHTVTGTFTLKTGPHTFYLGLQGVYGDSQWLRVAGTTAIDLPNDSFGSSYDSAKERSWQLRYDYNFVEIGIPGLTLMNRYIQGSNAHVGSVTDGRERGRETELAYVVQSGPLKKLSVKLRNITLRTNYGSNSSYDETRMIIQYPLKLL
jgi:porin-like protein GalP